MTPQDSVVLVDLVGFATGAVLYGMLLAMVLRWPAHATPIHGDTLPRFNGHHIDRVALATALLGLLWNAGGLALQAVRGLGAGEPHPLLAACAFVALGFLPAVVVHSALLGSEAPLRVGRTGWIIAGAYAVSAVAGVMHIASAAASGITPSYAALRLLTATFTLLIAALFYLTRGQPGRKRAVWAGALALFAVSALHLSYHTASEEDWWVELVGHHASLPLALAILYQDFKFALADIFLKRALALLALISVVCGAYALVAAPMLDARQAPGGLGPAATVTLLGLWVGTALLYPWLRDACTRFVDSSILRRVDYTVLSADVARSIAARQDPEAMLDETCKRLAPALSAREVWWSCLEDTGIEDAPVGRHYTRLAAGEGAAVLANGGATGSVIVPATRALLAPADAPHAPTVFAGASAVVTVPTVEPPNYVLVVSELFGGRRLLSDDIAMLGTISTILSRRIDAVRVAHERCQHDLRQQEISKLATETELRALRAQINPHFLFNALTTIGYLIQSAPERALDTLLRLTDLLRGVLRSSGEFCTLGEELDLVEAYLDIERARFEERLRVHIDVPPSLRTRRIPSLLLQPLVENAVKHGVSPRSAGGDVTIAAALDPDTAAGPQGGHALRISVTDTGLGASAMTLAHGRKRGVGLANIERRLHCHYGGEATLTIESVPGSGTVAAICIPILAADGAGWHDGLRGVESRPA
jgi:two-component system LytT family sensor kinase